MANWSNSVSKLKRCFSPVARKKFARRLLVEGLEPRALLAADLGWSGSISMAELTQLPDTEKGSVVPTHFYEADGVDRGMVVVSDRIALSRNETLDSSAQGPQVDILAQFGLTELRRVGDSFIVYSTQQPVTPAFISQLTANGFAETVVPVFGVLESRSEAVLLNEAIVALPEGVDAAEYFSDSDKFTRYESLAGTPDQFVVTLAAGYGEQALAEINQLEDDSQVTWASPNFYQNWQKFSFIPNDPRFSNQWHLHNTGQSGGTVDVDPNLPEAWDYFQPGGPPSSITIGMVDDGMSTDHPDLNAWVNTGEVAGNSIDDDGNGWVDDINGWNFVNDNNVSIPDTASDMHGTSVSGVAAARGNNALGVTGPAYNSSVISARMFRGSAVASDANIAAAIYYTSGRTKNGAGTWSSASIVNHSWGGGANSSAINNALSWATTSGRGGLGVIHVFASGNGFSSAVSYPSSLSSTNTGLMSIGAINNKNEKSDYSNYGAALDVVTPSNDTRAGYLAIDTTDRVGSPGYASGDYTGNGSTGFGGTSSATPLAVGIGTLALSRASQLGVTVTAADLKKLFRNNTKLAGPAAYDIATGRTELLSYGLLNAETLVKGIGRAQISVTTDRVVLDNGGDVDFGSAIVGEIKEVTFRVRNQGTQTLNLSGMTISSADFVVGETFGDTSLALGESTTFTVHFAPQSAGAKSATVSIASNDNLTPTLEFDVEGLAQTTNLSGKFYEDRDGDGTRDAGESGVSGQTVFIDQNANGIFDANLTSNNYTNSTPAAITDFATTQSTINVSGVGSTVTDVNVRVNLTHTYVSELEITLVAPNGTRVLLFNRRGGSGDNLVNTMFDDQAATAIATGTVPFTGSFRPDQVLSGVNGQPVDGTWTLEVKDNGTGDVGQLSNWTLFVTGGERATNSDAFGFYYFLDIPNGSYSAVASIASGWTASGTTQHPFTISNPNDTFSNRDFGVGKNDRFYAYVYDDLNANGAVNPGESGLPSRDLFVDVDSDGIFDPPVNVDFTNSSATPILDNSTINLPVAVSGVSTVVDVDITVNLTHTYDGDVEISLISPDNTQIMLSDNRGGSGDNYTNTHFDHEAATSIASGTAPFTGTFKPDGDLSQLYGSNGNGVWYLRIRDTANADTGTFLNWTLHLVAPSDIALETDADGWAQVDLPGGTSTINLLPEVGWEYTVPTDGSRQATASGTPHYNQLYGSRQPVEGISDTFVFHNAWTGPGSDVDTAKSLLKETGTAQTLGFGNLINSSQGINGVGFEIADIPGALTAADFIFQVSPTGIFSEGSNPPSGWVAGPAPTSVSVVQGATDQVLVEWANNAITNRWLRVTVKANANTGLSTPETYYVGHLRGETTGPEAGGFFAVSFGDIGEIRDEAGSAVGAGSIHDINKNGLVDFSDISAMRTSVGSQLTIVSVGGGSNIPGLGDNTTDPIGASKYDNVDKRTLQSVMPTKDLPSSSLVVPVATKGVGSNPIVERPSLELARTVGRNELAIDRLVATLASDHGRASTANRTATNGEMNKSDSVDQFFAQLATEGELSQKFSS